MRVLPFSIPKTVRASIIVQEDIQAVFYTRLHQHPEVQLSLIQEGKGDLYCMDRFWAYEPGDLILIPGNLPHLFKSDQDEPVHRRISIFHELPWLRQIIEQSPELEPLNPWLKRCSTGAIFRIQRQEAESRFSEILQTDKTMRYVKFLELLDWLKHKRGRSLQARNTIQPYSTVDGDRMSEVIDHSMQHYQGRVKLGELAEKVAMTPASFCKFFKRRTGRTYIDFLNEIRIEHACRLLAGSSKMSVAEIAEDSGFSNIANFNRRFKQYKDVTPSHYRRSHKSYSLGN